MCTYVHTRNDIDNEKKQCIQKATVAAKQPKRKRNYKIDAAAPLIGVTKSTCIHNYNSFFYTCV